MEQKKVQFSFIVPIYNVEEYLDRCVQSLINQSFTNIEIILVDDGSPDQCPEKCDNYAKQDPRIRVIHKANGGLSDARNAGLEVAIGEYILFVDADDYIELDTCEKLNNYTNKDADILIADVIVEGGACDLSHIFVDGVLSGKEYLKKALKKRKVRVVAWANAYKRAFLLTHNLRFKYGILHEDVDFTPRAFLLADTVYYTPISFYHYVIRNNSISKSKDKRKNARDLYNICCEHAIIYQEIQDLELKRLMLDFLVNEYLSMFQEAKQFEYGKEYIHKGFCIKNSYMIYTRLKSILFLISPIVYWYTNYLVKKIMHK